MGSNAAEVVPAGVELLDRGRPVAIVAREVAANLVEGQPALQVGPVTAETTETTETVERVERVERAEVERAELVPVRRQTRTRIRTRLVFVAKGEGTRVEMQTSGVPAMVLAPEIGTVTATWNARTQTRQARGEKPRTLAAQSCRMPIARTGKPRGGCRPVTFRPSPSRPRTATAAARAGPTHLTSSVLPRVARPVCSRTRQARLTRNGGGAHVGQRPLPTVSAAHRIPVSGLARAKVTMRTRSRRAA